MPQDDLDHLLASALRARPEPDPVMDLAARVLARTEKAARKARLQQARLQVLTRRIRWINLVAFAVMGILAAVLYFRLPDSTPYMKPDETFALSYFSVGEFLEEDPDVSQLDIELICGAILLAAILVISVEHAMRSPPLTGHAAVA